MPSLSCAVAIKDGRLYSSKKNEKQSREEKITLSSPFSQWSAATILDLGLTDANRMVAAGGDIIYVLTADNVMKISLSSSCDSGTVVQDKLLTSAFGWGTDISSITVAASSSLLFVCSKDRGLFSVPLAIIADAAPMQIAELGSMCSAAIFVEQHGVLYAGNDHVILSISDADVSSYKVSSHEWVGGIIDYAPTDFSYDAANNYLWLAEREALHRYESTSGAWLRFGYQQQNPLRNISTAAVSGGFVYVGSSMGMARVSTVANPVQLDGNLAPQVTVDGTPEPRHADPFVWDFYGGARWLPSNSIVALVPWPSSSGDEHSVLVVTTVGLTMLIVTPWTLEDKAAAELRLQDPNHDRHGLVSGNYLQKNGDRSSYVQYCDDNDGLWTSMSVMGWAYWALSDPDSAEAQRRTWDGFQGLETLSILPGAFPRYPARTFCQVKEDKVPVLLSRNDHAARCGDLKDPVWHPAAVAPNKTDGGRWFYKGDTSSDELCGHLAAYPVIFDAVRTDEQRQRVMALFDGILLGIIKSGYYLVDPTTGKPTTWGFWSPASLNDDADHYSERGPNSLQILAWCAAGYSMSGNQIYKTTFWTLVNDHGYARNAMNVKLDSSVDENHSDTELIFLAYHSIFYALQRLSKDDARRPELEQMTALLLPSLRRTWLLTKGESSPLWLSIYAGVAGQRVAEQELAAAEYSLRKWAVDNINWQIDGSRRQDLVLSPFTVRQGTAPLMKNTRPPSERVATHYNNDPFEITVGGDGSDEVEPAVFLLPYFMTKYFDLFILRSEERQ